MPLLESCQDVEASTVAPKKEVASSGGIYDLGFTNTPSTKAIFNSEKVSYYKQKTGLDFISDDSLLNFRRINNLSISDAQNFKGEIPKDKQEEIIANYPRLKPVKHYYMDNFWNEYYEVGVDRYGHPDPLKRKGVMVVAPIELFTENAFIKRDPIVVVKVDGGWLELARW